MCFQIVNNWNNSHNHRIKTSECNFCNDPCTTSFISLVHISKAQFFFGFFVTIYQKCSVWALDFVMKLPSIEVFFKFHMSSFVIKFIIFQLINSAFMCYDLPSAVNLWANMFLFFFYALLEPSSNRKRRRMQP